MSEPKTLSETDRLFLAAIAEFRALIAIWEDQLMQSYPDGTPEDYVTLPEVLLARQKVITLGSLLPTNA